MNYNPNQVQQQQSGDYYANLFNAGTLKAFKPSTKNTTVIRLFPEHFIEHTADGAYRLAAPKPMLAGFDASGPNFTGVRMEPIATLFGEHNKVTCFTRCSDVPEADDFTNPWSSLYIHLKSQLKKQVYSAQEEQFVRRIVEGEKATLKKPSNCLLAQGVVLSVNGKASTPAELNTPTAIILTPSAVSSFNKLLKMALDNKVDLYDYDAGYTFTVTGEKTTRAADDFVITAGQQMVVPPNFRGRWVPWEAAIRLKTMDEHIRQMVLCYGASTVAMRPALAQALERLGIAVPQRAQVANPAGFTAQPQAQSQPQGFYPVTQQPAASAGFGVQQTQAPVQTGFGQAQPAGFGAPAAAPQTAPAGFGAPAPTAPTAAPAGFGAPAAPAQPAGFGAPVAAPAGFGAPAAQPAGFGQPSAATPIPGVAGAVGQPLAPPVATAASGAAPANLEEAYKNLLK